MWTTNTCSQKNRILPSKELYIYLSFWFHIQSANVSFWWVLCDNKLSEEREPGHGTVTRKVDITALWGWITRRKMKRSERESMRSPTRSLGAHVDLGGEISSVVHLGGWVVQFADKLPFREAWVDLRAFSARLWVGVFPVWWCSSALRISSSLVSDASHVFLSWAPPQESALL